MSDKVLRVLDVLRYIFQRNLGKQEDRYTPEALEALAYELYDRGFYDQEITAAQEWLREVSLLQSPNYVDPTMSEQQKINKVAYKIFELLENAKLLSPELRDEFLKNIHNADKPLTAMDVKGLMLLILGAQGKGQNLEALHKLVTMDPPSNLLH
ncbi:MAG: DUF494 family protein [Gammaproteobacteria bacterium]|nr:DUF494 family protein [Gammaproteobacteria bacterium]